jgi:aryl carrier-like protein
VEADGGSCLAALGLDSLGLLELSLRVERRWGVKLGVWSDLQAKLTVEALAALIEQVRARQTCTGLHLLISSMTLYASTVHDCRAETSG